MFLIFAPQYTNFKSPSADQALIASSDPSPHPRAVDRSPSAARSPQSAAACAPETPPSMDRWHERPLASPAMSWAVEPAATSAPVPYAVDIHRPPPPPPAFVDPGFDPPWAEPVQPATYATMTSNGAEPLGYLARPPFAYGEPFAGQGPSPAFMGPAFLAAGTSRPRAAKEIAIGRWTNDEHRWFLKGLELFQGPAWGEIARLIGSRTSTQVRTHAQKFFTKLARLGQSLPHFDAQIRKERERLVAQGVAVAVASSTPTASAAGPTSFALASLSPSAKRSGALGIKRPLDGELSVVSAAGGQAGSAQHGFAGEPMPMPLGADAAVLLSPSTRRLLHWSPASGQAMAVAPAPAQAVLAPPPGLVEDDALPPMTKMLRRSAAN